MGAWDPRRTGQKETPPRGGVGVATLPRDRFGELVVEEAGKGPGDYQLPVVQSEFITAAVQLQANTSHRFYINADGLGAEAALKIELLDKDEKPLPGFSGAGGHAAVVRKSGFQTPITWNGTNEVRDCRSRYAFELLSRANATPISASAPSMFVALWTVSSAVAGL